MGTSDASGSDDATTEAAANTAPTVANPIQDQTATVGTALTYAFPANTFNDTDAGDTLAYTATKSDDSALPSWLSFAAATRTFSGTPTAADVGTVSVKVTASDGSDSVSDTFDIVVSAAADTTPPEVMSVTVPISGSQVELVFDEDLDETVAGNLHDSVFSLTVAGQAVTIADYDFQEATLFLYVQTGTIKQGQTVVVSYTDPTAADDTVALQDIAGNDVASFTTGQSGVPAVTNNSTNHAATGEPAITGTAQAGQELTAVTTGIMDIDGLTGVDFTYQWLRVDADGTSNEEDISGEIAETYTLTDDDVGKKVKVKVSFSDELSGEEERTSAAYPSSGTVIAASTNTAAMGAPTITGTAQVGKTLTAVTTGITDADGLTSPTYTYQWIRVDGTDEEDISGENSSTYTLVDADLGKTIKVKVTFTDDASNSETLTSAATVTVAADTTPPEVMRVTVNSTGSTVTLVFDEHLDDDAAGGLHLSAISLTAGGQAVTAPFADFNLQRQTLALTYRYGTIKQGQTVVFSYTDPTAGDDTDTLQDVAGNDVASFTTGQSGVPAVTNNSTNHAATGEPAITGTAQVGQDLTAVTTGIMDADGLAGVDFTYQWLRVDADGTSNEEDISGEIAATYTLTERRRGQEDQGAR